MNARKVLPFIVCVIAIGCASQEREFSELRVFLDERQSLEIPDAFGLSQKLKPLWVRDKASIRFLKTKLEAPDVHDRIAAYLAIEELVAQVRSNPSREGTQILAEIDLQSVYDRFDKFDSSNLSENWRLWFTETHRMMKKNLGSRDSDGPASELAH